MQLQPEVLKIINKVPIRLRLAMALKVSEQTIKIYIRDNGEDLTKAAALAIIREETNLTDEEILAKEKAQTA